MGLWHCATKWREVLVCILLNFKAQKEENFPFIAIVLFFSFLRNAKVFVLQARFSLSETKKTSGGIEKVSPCRLRIRSTVCCMQEFSWLFLLLFAMLSCYCCHCSCKIMHVKQMKIYAKVSFYSLHFLLVFSLLYYAILSLMEIKIFVQCLQLNFILISSSERNFE